MCGSIRAGQCRQQINGLLCGLHGLLSVGWAVARPSRGLVEAGAGCDPDGRRRLWGRALSWKAGRTTLRWEPEVWAGEWDWGGGSPSLIPRVSELSPSHRPNPASPSMAPPSRSQVPKGCKGPACALRCFTVSASMGQGPPGSSVHGILQARALGWGALLQGTFPTQGPTVSLVSCTGRRVLYH